MNAAIKERPSAPEVDEVGVEQCAEAFATVRHFPKVERAAVLARFGLDEERFSASLSTIARNMGGALAKEDPRLMLRFAAAYGAADRRVRMERPRVKDIHPMAAGVVPLQAVPPAPGQGAAPPPREKPKDKKVRFVKYDPQTGRLLHTPRWEEDDA